MIATASREELDKAAAASKMKNKSATSIWDLWFEEVAKKVPLKRLVKLIPVPNEITQAVNLEAENYASVEEMEEGNKINEAINALDSLNNEINTKDSHTLQEVLDHYQIDYELKQGYVKVKPEDLKKSLLSDVKLPLIEHKKVKNGLIGKALERVNIELDDLSEEIEYEEVKVIEEEQKEEMKNKGKENG